LLFGFTGLLSFGHALFFASGMYFTGILMNKNITLFVAAPIAVAITWVVATLVGWAALRTSGIAFAMVTLAFGEAGHVLISRTFTSYTNGDNGLALNGDQTPEFLLGVINTKNLYWLALATLILIYFIVWWITESSAGRVFAALRDNEVRVNVLGLNPAKFKLFAFVLAGTLAAIIGSMMLVVAGTATPHFATADVTIALLLMVILGGAVSRWGAVLGGIVYSVASTRLQEVTSSESLANLPHWLKGPLSEPTFILGLIFILVVMYSPGGLSGAYYRIRARLAS
jgi:branched-chain amino acid transport system permease protein